MRTTISHFYPNLASSAYNSKRATIYRWARSRASLEAALAEASESEIAEWDKELRGDGIPVSTMMLTEKALEVLEEAGVQDFKASDKWVVGFKRRYKYSLRCPTRQSQSSPANIQCCTSKRSASRYACLTACRRRVEVPTQDQTTEVLTRRHASAN
ncbi:Tc5 transposase DNA-binding domain [Phytophthora infestans]|uniref:Tc5 transposase DNA-binding domain n=1 Tax=Phytophthora infestans TaxID=4787 RepID=A0A833WEU7_PHYIN|nr:Tc5 transposase DNA-binding domain [Phytophthora infestans]KAF4132374.1 Tc5 transposase DNA-binding domain [Phytophthora infestans]